VPELAQIQLNFEDGNWSSSTNLNDLVDPEGGNGKTFFQKYCLSKLPGVQLMATCKRDDLAYMINKHMSIFLFNVPRGGLQFLSYVLFAHLFLTPHKCKAPAGCLI